MSRLNLTAVVAKATRRFFTTAVKARNGLPESNDEQIEGSVFTLGLGLGLVHFSVAKTGTTASGRNITGPSKPEGRSCESLRQ